MNPRLLLLLLLNASAAAGCFQSIDTGVASGPLADPTVTAGADAGARSVQCATGSAECFARCGSPSCALPDGAIPPSLNTPMIYLADGKTVTNPCDAIEAQSRTIRQHACAVCHGGGTSFQGFDYVLDDAKLITKTSSIQPSLKMVVPGDPENSYVFQRILSGAMPPPMDTAMPLIGAKAAATIAYPGADDVSALYGWILNCVKGADGGAYGASYYGGNFAPGAAGNGGDGTGASDGGGSRQEGGADVGVGGAGGRDGGPSVGAIVDAGRG